jgi:hypothetical protein
VVVGCARGKHVVQVESVVRDVVGVVSRVSLKKVEEDKDTTLARFINVVMPWLPS